MASLSAPRACPAMGRPPVLGSTLSPNFTGCVMIVLLVWSSGPASGDPAEGAGEQVLLAGSERVQQALADGLRVHRHGAAQHVLTGRGDGEQHASPIVSGTGPRQPAALGARGGRRRG